MKLKLILGILLLVLISGCEDDNLFESEKQLIEEGWTLIEGDVTVPMNDNETDTILRCFSEEQSYYESGWVRCYFKVVNNDEKSERCNPPFVIWGQEMEDICLK